MNSILQYAIFQFYCDGRTVRSEREVEPINNHVIADFYCHI